MISYIFDIQVTRINNLFSRFRRQLSLKCDSHVNGSKKFVEILYGLHFGFCFPPDAATTTTEQEMQEEDDDAARRRGSKNKLKRQHRMYDFELEWGYSRHSYEKTVARMHGKF